jgi:hypothetical protein
MDSDRAQLWSLPLDILGYLTTFMSSSDTLQLGYLSKQYAKVFLHQTLWNAMSAKLSCSPKAQVVLGISFVSRDVDLTSSATHKTLKILAFINTKFSRGLSRKRLSPISVAFLGPGKKNFVVELSGGDPTGDMDVQLPKVEIPTHLFSTEYVSGK